MVERFHVLAADSDADPLAPLVAHPHIEICLCDLKSDSVWPFVRKKIRCSLVHKLSVSSQTGGIIKSGG